MDGCRSGKSSSAARAERHSAAKKATGSPRAGCRSAARTAAATLARTVPLIVVLALAVALAGCGSRQGEGFAVYLLPDNSSPAGLPAVSELKLAAAPLLTTADIVSYSRGTHEMELTPAAYSALEDLVVPLSGLAFAVCVDRRPIYTGGFMTPIWSGTFDGVVIMRPMKGALPPKLSIALNLGYPGPDWFKGHDPRSDPAVMKALEKAGKLK